MKRFILFSGKRHPRELGALEVIAFVNHLALERQMAASTQNQALAANLFMYKEVLAMPLPWLSGSSMRSVLTVSPLYSRAMKFIVCCLD